MNSNSEPTKLDVAAALEHGALHSAIALHRAAENPTIDNIALVSRPEQARRVAPRAAVIIAAGPETSGWLVSSVLRYAWERRASVVIAAGTQPDSVLALAQRLDITLVSTNGDPTKLALDLSADIGAAKAAVGAQLVALLRVVTRERTVDSLLRAATSELGGTALELIFRGTVVAASGSHDHAGRQAIGPYPVTETPGDGVSLVAFPPRGAGRAGFADAALHLLLPALRAVWLDTEAADRLDGLAAAASIPDSLAAGSAVVGQLGWRDDESRFVVLLAATDGHVTRSLGNVVRLIWHRAMGRGALVATDGGWVAVLRADEETGSGSTLRRLRSRLSPALAELGVSIGVSTVADSPARLRELVTEARLAARCAWAEGEAAVASFADLRLEAIGYLFDPEDARTIASLVVPEFCAAPDLDKLVESVGAFLDEGSVSSAAIALSVHRNTLTARLDRARALGLPVGEPRMAFAIAAVVRALDPRHSGATPTTTTDEGVVP